MLHSSTHNDIDLLEKTFRCFDSSYSQLERGRFFAQTREIRLPGISICEQSTNRSFSFRGKVPSDCIHLRLWTCRNGTISSKGRIAGPRAILVGLPSEEIDLTVIGASSSLDVTFESEKINAFLKTNSGVHRCDHRKFSSFQNTDETSFETILRGAQHTIQYPQENPFDETISFSSISHLLRQAMQAEESCSTIDRALGYMRENIAKPLKLDDLCQFCGWSKRSMIYHFIEVFGIAPMAYFKIERLNAVRRALKNTDSGSIRISDIAARFGFHHMGHFAADYRRLFDVLPSHTFGTSNSHG